LNKNFTIDFKDYAIASGQRLRIMLPGSFFQLMEATGTVDVDFLRAESAFGRAVDVPLGFSVGPLKDATFDGLEIYSATAQTLKVCVARGAVDLRALTQVTGTVQVINGELSRVANNEAFSGPAAVTASAGQYADSQLWNPPASGKNLVVTRMSVFSVTAAGVVHISSNAAALTTLNQYGKSKKIGGAAGVGQLRYASSVAAIAVNPRLQSVALDAAFKILDLPLSEPLLVPPGSGIVVEHSAVANHLNATYQWYEEGI
jgi:hypothetical protein